MDKGQFPIFARAFAALLYSPSVAMSLLLSKHVHVYSGKNITSSYIHERCIFSSYCDVVQLYNKFGPILPVPNAYKVDPDLADMKMFYEMMTMDVFCKEQSRKGGSKTSLFHSYCPSDDTKLSNDHLSSNIPNFVSLICLALHLYELSDADYNQSVSWKQIKEATGSARKNRKGKDGSATKSKTVEKKNPAKDLDIPLLFDLFDDDKYIMLTNKLEIYDLFDKRRPEGPVAPVINIPEEKKDEKYFRERYLVNRGLLTNEFGSLCYVKDLKLKIMFLTVRDWKERNLDNAICYSMVDRKSVV